jgi:phage baseplate assembly protein W
MNTKKYAPKLPIDVDDNGNFIKISDALQNAKQNLRMLILTNPGEKLMYPDFGVGIRRYLFESTNGIVKINSNNGSIKSVELQNFQQSLANSIQSQVSKYANDIIIKSVQVSLQEQILNLRIEYIYKEALNDELQLTISL